jgi:restriction system protein
VILFAAFAIVVLTVATSLVGVLAGLRPRRSKGEAGERLAAKCLKDLNPAFYRIFHDLYLPRLDGRGTTQVDHVVLSRFGVFVVETKNYDGWIFGGARQKMWTQSIFGRNTQFQNPLHQNHLHVLALRSLLGLSDRSFHSLVFFVDGDFRSEMPHNVICSDLCGWIAGHKTTLLSEEALHEAVRRMEKLEKNTHRKTAKALHLQELRSNPDRPAPPEVVEIQISDSGHVVQVPSSLSSPWIDGDEARLELGRPVMVR